MAQTETNKRGDKQRQKKLMSRMGYYLASDFAAISGVTRQYISKRKKDGELKVWSQFGREWIKWDDGEHSETIYGKDTNVLEPFLRFGFNQRLRSLITGDPVCDIKHLRDNEVDIRFYNEAGQMLRLVADLSTIEIIDEHGNNCQTI